MPPRRTHTKSRNGCAKCKKRRVKCDEVHPACGNCVKHAIECDFSSLRSSNTPDIILSPPATTPGSSITANSPASISEHSPASISEHSPASISEHSPASTITLSDASPPLIHQSFAFLPNVSTQGYFQQHQHHLILPPTDPFRWTTEDMVLMHHFTTAGPECVVPRADLHELWKTTIPKLAFNEKSGCAMHGMLAVSALHLAFIEPENRVSRLMTATAHYDRAVRATSLMVPDIRKDNCEAVFVASMMIVIFATAFSLVPGNGSSDNGPWTMPEWVPLIRGVHSVLTEGWSWVETGCLAPLLKFNLYEGPEHTPNEMTTALDTLYRLCTDSSEPDPEDVKDTDTSSIYFGAIHKLRKSFVGSFDPECNATSLIFLWPICVSDKYVALLKQRRPRALIIFAYYCVLMKQMEVYWWIGGRAEYELARIERSIDDLEKWKKWLEWPVKMVRGESKDENIPAVTAP